MFLHEKELLYILWLELTINCCYNLLKEKNNKVKILTEKINNFTNNEILYKSGN